MLGRGCHPHIGDAAHSHPPTAAGRLPRTPPCSRPLSPAQLDRTDPTSQQAPSTANSNPVGDATTSRRHFARVFRASLSTGLKHPARSTRARMINRATLGGRGVRRVHVTQVAWNTLRIDSRRSRSPPVTARTRAPTSRSFATDCSSRRPFGSAQVAVCHNFRVDGRRWYRCSRRFLPGGLSQEVCRHERKTASCLQPKK